MNCPCLELQGQHTSMLLKRIGIFLYIWSHIHPIKQASINQVSDNLLTSGRPKQTKAITVTSNTLQLDLMVLVGIPPRSGLLLAYSPLSDGRVEPTSNTRQVNLVAFIQTPPRCLKGTINSGMKTQPSYYGKR